MIVTYATIVDMKRHIILLILLITLNLTLTLPTSFAQDEEALQARVVELYNQAEDAHEKKQFDKAIGLYKEAIKLAPEIFEPKFQCAVAMLASKKPELLPDAVVLLKEVVTLKPDFARGYLLLGDALARVDNLTEAETALRQALKLDEKLPAREILADVLIARGAYKEAEAELKLLIEAGRADWQNYLSLGIAQQAGGQLAGALTSYSRALELHPNDGEICYRRGRVYLEQKNYAAAISDFKIAYQTNQDIDIGLALAESYAGNGDKQPAIELAQTLVTKANAEQRTPCTELLARLGANAAAIAELEKQLAQEPQNLIYLVRLGELYLDLSPIRSSEYWQQAVKLKATPENLVGLGSALLKAQRFEQAAHHFNAALAQKPDLYEAHAGLGLALFKLEQFAPAAEQFIWVTRARPDYAINCYFLAICFDRLGDFQRALAGYELFLKLTNANAKRYQLEIDKVNLRLPSLRRQLEKSSGKKR